MINLTWDGVQDLAHALINRNPQCKIVYGIPTGGSFVAQALYLGHSQVLEILDTPPATPHKNLVIIDDLIGSGKTMQPWHDKGFVCDALLRKSISPSNLAPEARLVDGWVKFPWEHESGPEDAVVRLLDFIGEDPHRGGLQETPSRVIKAWKEWTSGYSVNTSTIFKEFKDGAEQYDEAIVLSPIPFYTHCEHHLAAIFGSVHIGYIPNGKIAGLSKFARLVDAYAKRLQVQERMTRQIANDIEKYLEPQGVAVYVEGRHFCMESRGVCKPGVVTSSAIMRGSYKDNDKTRAEFYSLIRR